MEELILVRYGELSLKKTNRKFFIRTINQNIQAALREFTALTYESKGLRFYIRLNGTWPIPVVAILQKIPGIYSFSLVVRCDSQLDQIKSLALEVIKEKVKPQISFKVETKRADKLFPLTSLEITQEVAGYLFKNLPDLTAEMKKPDLILNLDVRPEGTYLYCETIMGLGGFPAGSQGRALLLLSGGIDSVVAGYLSLKKGLDLIAVHFASPPYTSDLALQKVVDLAQELSVYTKSKTLELIVVPFTKLQQVIYQTVRADYGVTIMRRMMYRLSEELAFRYGALALINGESIGQVASQTLESINTIAEAVQLPIIRPLITMDKQEIVALATKIATFDISIRPYEDCCTLFVPRHPQIKPLKAVARQEESKFDYQELINQSLVSLQTLLLSKQKPYHVLNLPTDIL